MFRVFLTSVVVLCAGCAPVSTYYKPGVSAAKLQNDQLDCEVKALQAAPVAIQTRRTPPRYIPARRYCHAKGHCHTRGGYWIHGDVYSVDVNAKLRRKLETQCMTRKNYQPVELPICRSGVPAEIDTSRTDALPEITPQSCAVRNRDGSFEILTENG